MNAFDNFYSNKTPLNAIRLAIADHQANGRRGVTEFVDALHDAEAICEQNAVMMAALRLIAAGNNKALTASQVIARTVLAKVVQS